MKNENEDNGEVCNGNVLKDVDGNGNICLTWCREPATHEGVMQITSGSKRFVFYRCASCVRHAVACGSTVTWTEIDAASLASDLNPCKQIKLCSCTMTEIMRSGCKCGGK